MREELVIKVVGLKRVALQNGSRNAPTRSGTKMLAKISLRHIMHTVQGNVVRQDGEEALFRVDFGKVLTDWDLYRRASLSLEDLLVVRVKFKIGSKLRSAGAVSIGVREVADHGTENAIGWFPLSPYKNSAKTGLGKIGLTIYWRRLEEEKVNGPGRTFPDRLANSIGIGQHKTQEKLIQAGVVAMGLTMRSDGVEKQGEWLDSRDILSDNEDNEKDTTSRGLKHHRNTSSISLHAVVDAAKNVASISSPSRMSNISFKKWLPSSAGVARKTLMWSYSQMRGPMDLKELESRAAKGKRALLIVEIIEARGLLAKDPNGLSDPYCILTFKNSKRKTKVVKRTLAPVWNEVFVFGGESNPEEIVAEDDTLSITVKDYDIFQSDDPLGVLELPLWALDGSAIELVDQNGKVTKTNDPGQAEIISPIPSNNSASTAVSNPDAVSSSDSSDSDEEDSAILDNLEYGRRGDFDGVQLPGTTNVGGDTASIGEASEIYVDDGDDSDRGSFIELANDRESVGDYDENTKKRRSPTNRRLMPRRVTQMILGKNDQTSPNTRERRGSTSSSSSEESGSDMFQSILGIKRRRRRTNDGDGNTSDDESDMDGDMKIFQSLPVLVEGVDGISGRPRHHSRHSSNFKPGKWLAQMKEGLAPAVPDGSLLGFKTSAPVRVRHRSDAVWYRLGRAPGMSFVRGEIKVRVTYYPAVLDSEKGIQASHSEFASQTVQLPFHFREDSPYVRQRPIARVHIIQARNLMIADSNGKSDPYVIIRCRETSFRSNVSKRTLNPVWEEVFEFGNSRDFLIDNDVIHILVRDRDLLFSDDDLGQVSLPLWSVKGEMDPQWYALEPTTRMFRSSTRKRLRGKPGQKESLVASPERRNHSFVRDLGEIQIRVEYEGDYYLANVGNQDAIKENAMDRDDLSNAAGVGLDDEPDQENEVRVEKVRLSNLACEKPNAVSERTDNSCNGDRNTHHVVKVARKRRDSYKLYNGKVWFYELKVRVVSGRDLPPSNLSGTCDAFAVVSCANQTYQTNIIYGSNHPIWKARFTFRESMCPGAKGLSRHDTVVIVIKCSRNRQSMSPTNVLTPTKGGASSPSASSSTSKAASASLKESLIGSVVVDLSYLIDRMGYIDVEGCELTKWFELDTENSPLFSASNTQNEGSLQKRKRPSVKLSFQLKPIAETRMVENEKLVLRLSRARGLVAHEKTNIDADGKRYNFKDASNTVQLHGNDTANFTRTVHNVYAKAKIGVHNFESGTVRMVHGHVTFNSHMLFDSLDSREIEDQNLELSIHCCITDTCYGYFTIPIRELRKKIGRLSGWFPLDGRFSSTKHARTGASNRPDVQNQITTGTDMAEMKSRRNGRPVSGFHSVEEIEAELGLGTMNIETDIKNPQLDDPRNNLRSPVAKLNVEKQEIELSLRLVSVEEELLPTLGYIHLNLLKLKTTTNDFAHDFRAVARYGDKSIATRTFRGNINPTFSKEEGRFRFVVKDSFTPLTIEIRDMKRDAKKGTRVRGEGKLFGAVNLSLYELVELQARNYFSRVAGSEATKFTTVKFRLTDSKGKERGSLRAQVGFEESLLGTLSTHANPAKREKKKVSIQTLRHEMQRMYNIISWSWAISSAAGRLMSWNDPGKTIFALVILVMFCTVDFWTQRPLALIPFLLLYHILERHYERVNGSFTARLFHKSTVGLNDVKARLWIAPLKAENLVPLDNNGRSDPFVRVSYTHDPAHLKGMRGKTINIGTTRTAYETLNPVWSESSAGFKASGNASLISWISDARRNSRVPAFEAYIEKQLYKKPHVSVQLCTVRGLDNGIGMSNGLNNENYSNDGDEFEISDEPPRRVTITIVHATTVAMIKWKKFNEHKSMTLSARQQNSKSIEVVDPILEDENKKDELLEIQKGQNRPLFGIGFADENAEDRVAHETYMSEVQRNGTWNEEFVFGDKALVHPQDTLVVLLEELDDAGKVLSGRTLYSFIPLRKIALSKRGRIRRWFSLEKIVDDFQVSGREYGTDPEQLSVITENDEGNDEEEDEQDQSKRRWRKSGDILLSIRWFGALADVKGDDLMTNDSKTKSGLGLGSGSKLRSRISDMETNVVDEDVEGFDVEDYDEGLDKDDDDDIVVRVASDTSTVVEENWKNTSTSIVMEVFDEDDYSRREFLGRAELPLSWLIRDDSRQEQPIVEMWLPLSLRFDSSRSDEDLWETSLSLWNLSDSEIEEKIRETADPSHPHRVRRTTEKRPRRGSTSSVVNSRFANFLGRTRAFFEGDFSTAIGPIGPPGLPINRSIDGISKFPHGNARASFMQEHDVKGLGCKPLVRYPPMPFGRLLVRAQLLLPDPQAEHRLRQAEEARKADRAGPVDQYNIIIKRLQWFQDWVFWFNNRMETLKNLFNWTHPRKTEFTMRLVIFLLLLFVIFPSKYIILAVGIFLFTEHFRPLGVIKIKLFHLLALVPTDDDLVEVYTSGSLLASNNARSLNASAEDEPNLDDNVDGTGASLSKAVALANKSTTTRNFGRTLLNNIKERYYHSVFHHHRGPHRHGHDNKLVVSENECKTMGHLRILERGHMRGSVWRRYFFAIYEHYLLYWPSQADVFSSASLGAFRDITSVQPVMAGSADAMYLISKGCTPSAIKTAFVINHPERRSQGTPHHGITNEEVRQNPQEVSKKQRTFLVANSVAKRDVWIANIQKFCEPRSKLARIL